jgi:hypothetical protein
LSLPTSITTMADYYSIISRAIGTLDPNTREARRRLYGRARTALLAEIRRAYPALDQPDIMATRKSLEVAIGKVEAQAQRDQRAHQEPADAVPLPSPHQQSLRERVTACPTFRATIADYYSLVAKATNALGAHTEEARRRVYDHARAALLSEVHKLVPALDRSKIMAEQLHLELAIGEVEADTQREQCAQSAEAAPLTAFPRGGALAAPRPPADQNDGEGSGSLRRGYGQDFRRSGKGAAAREQVRNTWLTELLARASREMIQNDQDSRRSGS